MICTRLIHIVGVRAAHMLAKTVRLTISRLTYFMDCDLMRVIRAVERSWSAFTSYMGASRLTLARSTEADCPYPAQSKGVVAVEDSPRGNDVPW